MRLRVTDPADRDVEDILEYGLRTYSERQAIAYASDLIDAFRWISNWPLTARLHDDIRPPVRLWPCGAHNVIYTVREDEVVILRIFHHSADWKKHL